MPAGLSYGQLLTAAQWNTLFDSKPDLIGGNLTVPGALTGAQVLFPATKVFSGALSTGNAQIYQTTTWTGTNSGTDITAFNHIYVNDRTNSGLGAGQGSFGLYIGHVIDSSAKVGTASALQVVFGVNAQSGNVAAGVTGINYTAATFTAIASVNDGGTALVPAGAIFGINGVAQITTGFWQGVVGAEIDVLVLGGTVQDKIGLQITLTSADAVFGTRDDVAFSLNNQAAPSNTFGWKYGLQFGRFGGYFPVRPAGTLIGAAPGAGVTVAHGIDWTGIAFTVDIFKAPGVLIAGTGAATFSNLLVQNGALANYVQVVPAATGLPVAIYAQGTDANVSLFLNTQGTGSLQVGNGSVTALQAAPLTGGNGYLTVASGIAASRPVQLFANGTGNNILVGGPYGGGGIAAAATSGFLMIPYISLPPTGAPLNSALGAAICFDAGTNKLWIYNGTAAAWKFITLA